MHLPDGILPAGVLVAGYVATGATTWFALRKINALPDPRAAVPKASLLTAAFFAATLLHIPIPPTSVHLLLNGLMGVLLGWYAFPAIAIGLFFQAIMFQHGGLTALGVNAVLLGWPALLAGALFHSRRYLPGGQRSVLTIAFGFLGGALGVGLAAVMAYVLLIVISTQALDPVAEATAIKVLTLAYLPLIFIEGVVTAFLVAFLQRVKPSLLGPA